MIKTILQVVQHLKPGGIETMALDLQQHLGNCHVHIVSLEGARTPSLQAWPRLKTRKDNLHFLDKKPGLRFSTILKLVFLIKRLKVDAVHTHHIGPLTYAGIAARICGIKHLVHTEHDAWHLEEKKSAKLESKLIKHLKPSLVADCSLVAEKLQKLTPHASPYVIYNGVNTGQFFPSNADEKKRARDHFGLPQGAQIIGCAARLEKVKGISYLIAAINSLPKDIYLVIAGDGSLMQRLKRQAGFNSSGERIIFLGRIDNMALFYNAIDIFCLPSLNEGFPLSPLEAQACNIPAVITDVGGAKETLCPQTGILVPSKNANALMKALRQKLRCMDKHTPRLFVQQKADIRLMTTAYAKLLAI